MNRLIALFIVFVFAITPTAFAKKHHHGSDAGKFIAGMVAGALIERASEGSGVVVEQYPVQSYYCSVCDGNYSRPHNHYWCSVHGAYFWQPHNHYWCSVHGAYFDFPHNHQVVYQTVRPQQPHHLDIDRGGNHRGGGRNRH